MQDVKDIKFSIIIPAYNAAQTIEATLESCFLQSYDNYEIIVVDDASTDNTHEVLEGYGDRIMYKRLSSNQGSSAARNMGMDKATGDYYAFLDADDLWHKDRLQLISNILTSRDNIDFFYHPFTTDKILSKQLPENITLYKLPFIKLLYGNIIGTPCVVMRSELKYRFEPAMRYMEDYDLWLRVGYKHSLYFIDLPLTQIGRPVLSKGGLSASRWKMRKGEMRAYARLRKLNFLFIFLLPFLITGSIAKHLLKLVIK